MHETLKAAGMWDPEEARQAAGKYLEWKRMMSGAFDAFGADVGLEDDGQTGRIENDLNWFNRLSRGSEVSSDQEILMDDVPAGIAWLQQVGVFGE
jgi:hypothetical protein